MTKESQVSVQNVHTPGNIRNLNAEKFEAVKAAYLKVIPGGPPGLTPREILAAMLEHLPQDLFPGGAKAGWWAKSVQLDLEAKGVIVRQAKGPVRLHRV
jgi:hypothetical protein